MMDMLKEWARLYLIVTSMKNRAGSARPEG